MSAPWTGGSDPGSDRPSVDGDFTNPSAIGAVRISFPFEHDSHAPAVDRFIYDPSPALPPAAGYYNYAPDTTQNNSRTDCFILEQEFEQSADYFQGLALDTAYDQSSYAPDYAGALPLAEAILIGESATTPSGNGLVRWTRTYCRMPGLMTAPGYFSRNEYEQATFTFPGFAATTVFQLDNEASEKYLQMPPGGIVANGSAPFTTTITARVQCDYFLVPAGAFTPNNVDNTLPSYNHLPFIVYGTAGTNVCAFVADPEFYNEGKFTDLKFHPLDPPFTYTTPPKTDQDADGFLGYLTALNNGWEICVRGSDIKPWRGNIYQRITWFAAAQ